MKPTIFLSALLLLGQALTFAQPLANPDVVFVTRAGTNTSGTPIMRVADSASDPRIAQLYQRVMRDRGVQRIVESHRDEQRKSMQRLAPAGSHLNIEPDPVYIEVGSGVGTYNDWSGTFELNGMQQGRKVVDQSRVVIDLNDSMFRARDTSLVEQTFVHEIAHGIMRQTYGKANLPETPWLGKPHYGDLVTDEALAIIEGWAEFAGAHFTGRNTIAEDPPESISQNAYAYTDQGTPKPPEDLMKTEGWVATVLLWFAQHPSVSDGYDKLLTAMRQGKHASLNDLLKTALEMYPETSSAITSILTKASINQISEPLGAPLDPSSTQTQVPPAVNVATGTSGGSNENLTRLFDDYQSSMNTLAQLKSDLTNHHRFPGAYPPEIQRRLSFQKGLVQSLRSQLLNQLKQNPGSGTQELIAQKVLDSLEHIRYEHNELLKSYRNLSFWDQNQKQRIQSELATYQELYQQQKQLADQMDSSILSAVWEQRQERIRYRLAQAQSMQEQQAAAPASPENCYLGNCKDAYHKLLGAIEANRRSQQTRELLNEYDSTRQ